MDASVAAHFAAFKAVKPNVNEREISALMQYEWGKRGCERPAYAPIVGSGFYSTVLHYSDDSNVMKSGDVVVIDAAGEYSMYASDITRTLPINGHFTARQREIYDIVLGAQQAAEAAFKSGKSNMKRDDPDSLYKVAYDYINTHGKDLHGDPWEILSFTVWDIPLASTCMTPPIPVCRWGRGRFSPLSQVFIFQRKVLEYGSKTTITWIRTAS